MHEEGAILLRPAGLLERYHITRHSLGLDSCVISVAKYNTPSGNGTLHKDALFSPLAYLIQSHAALSVTVRTERSKKPYFARLPSIDLDKVIRSSRSDQDLVTFMEDDFLIPFDVQSDLPLWRLTILPENTIAFSYFHAIGDGQSGLAFHRNLLAALNKADLLMQPLHSGGVVKVPATTHLVGAIESLTDLRVSISTLSKEILGLILPTSLTRSSTWSGNDVPQPSLRNHVRIITIPPPTLTSFLSHCREHNATLTSAVYTVLVTTISQLLAEAPKARKRYKTISTSVPVSLRPFTGATAADFCDHVSALHSNEPVAPTGFVWSRATDFATKLRSSVAGTRETIGCLKYLFGHYDGYFMGKIGRKREVGIELSNLGSFHPEKKPGGWCIEKVYFAQNDGVQGAALKVNVVGDPKGRLAICITWGEAAVEDDFAESFARRLKSSLLELGK